MDYNPCCENPSCKNLNQPAMLQRLVRIFLHAASLDIFSRQPLSPICFLEGGLYISLKTCHYKVLMGLRLEAETLIFYILVNFSKKLPADFFSKLRFSKNLSRSKQVRSRSGLTLSGLIWVQTICNGY